MNQTDLAFTPALKQAELIRAGDVTPTELTELYLRRIQQANPVLGSYFTILAEQALADARHKTEILAQHSKDSTLPAFFGVPIAIKDLDPMKDVRFTIGSHALKDNIATFDNAIVGRIKQAGFVILGKTATPELGTMPFTEPQGFPPARNPWNTDYTPGGSSGGAASALAAGLCAIAQGSDGAGSIRGPAFCCGLVGIKPARGRISYAPIGDTPGGIATGGPLAHTVADAAAFLDVTAGYVTGDPYWLPDPPESFLSVALRHQNQSASNRLRIGFLSHLAPVGDADPICEQAVLDTAKRLESLGHTLEPIQLDVSSLIEPFTVVFRAGVGSVSIPVEALSDINQWFMSHHDLAGTYFKRLWEMQGIARQIVGAMLPYDAVLMPTYMHPAIQIGAWSHLAPEALLEEVKRWILPCPAFNATGQPAIALPTGFSQHNLPVGVQLVGRPADEATLIAIAAQLEALNPWTDRPAMAEMD